GPPSAGGACGIVAVESGSRGAPRWSAELGPIDHGVACGVADGGAAEVDQGRERPTAVNEQVVDGDVAVNPPCGYTLRSRRCAAPERGGAVPLPRVEQR